MAIHSTSDEAIRHRSQLMRLAKYLASAGIASRRASEQIVRAGRVTVGRSTVTDPARDVGPQDDVRLDGKSIQPPTDRVVYALNKPAGVVSTARDPQGRPTVVSLLPSELRLYPVETHLAEKLHAYTIPRVRPNSRIKDLPDLALLGTIRPLEATRLRRAFAQTFEFRRTHALPESLPPPPPSWAAAYARLAEEDQLPWRTLDEVTIAAKTFLDPVLGDTRVLRWDPDAWGVELTCVHVDAPATAGATEGATPGATAD